MIRNQSGQVVTANLVNRNDGFPVILGSVVVEVLGQGGVKEIGLGTIENEGGGTWSYFPTISETDYYAITFSFTHPDAISVDVQVNTRLQPQPDTNLADLSAISRAFGPKTVKTKHIEVTQFSPQEIAMLQDRANALEAYPSTCSIFANACIAEPDEEAYKPNYRGGRGCGCN